MYPLWCPNFVLCKTAFLRAFKVPTMRHLVSPVVLRSVSPVDGWTIAFQANGPQGAWTTLWTGVDGPKRQPAHCPDHRDCPHPRAFAHAPHRAKGVTGSPFGFVLGEGLVSQGGQIDLDAPKPDPIGGRNSRIDRLEDSPASPLAFQHAGFRSLPELD